MPRSLSLSFAEFIFHTTATYNQMARKNVFKFSEIKDERIRDPDAGDSVPEVEQIPDDAGNTPESPETQTENLKGPGSLWAFTQRRIAEGKWVPQEYRDPKWDGRILDPWEVRDGIIVRQDGVPPTPDPHILRRPTSLFLNIPERVITEWQKAEEPADTPRPSAGNPWSNPWSWTLQASSERTKSKTLGDDDGEENWNTEEKDATTIDDAITEDEVDERDRSGGQGMVFTGESSDATENNDADGDVKGRKIAHNKRIRKSDSTRDVRPSSEASHSRRHNTQRVRRLNTDGNITLDSAYTSSSPSSSSSSSDTTAANIDRSRININEFGIFQSKTGRLYTVPDDDASPKRKLSGGASNTSSNRQNVRVPGTSITGEPGNFPTLLEVGIDRASGAIPKHTIREGAASEQVPAYRIPERRNHYRYNEDQRPDSEPDTVDWRNAPPKPKRRFDWKQHLQNRGLRQRIYSLNRQQRLNGRHNTGVTTPQGDIGGDGTMPTGKQIPVITSTRKRPPTRPIPARPPTRKFPRKIVNKRRNKRFIPPPIYNKFKDIDTELEIIERKLASLDLIRKGLLNLNVLDKAPDVKPVISMKWKDYDYDVDDLHRFRKEKEKTADNIREMILGKREWDHTANDHATVGLVCRATQKGLQYACPECWCFHDIHHQDDED